MLVSFTACLLRWGDTCSVDVVVWFYRLTVMCSMSFVLFGLWRIMMSFLV